MTSPRVYYIDKPTFLAKIVEYKKVCREAKKAKKPKPPITTYLATCIMHIAENLSHSPKYVGWTFRDLMVADAVENCIRYFDNFDPNHVKKNPFGYFTQCCVYAFWRRCFIERREQYTKYKIAQQSGTLDDMVSQENDDNGGDVIQQQLLYDNISEFIKRFEDDLKKARDKSKANTKERTKAKLEAFMEDKPVKKIALKKVAAKQPVKKIALKKVAAKQPVKK
ncbi:MAG: hypothetical protein ACREQ5_03500, partial [Candidatus Dormibacteria bacterium]